MFLVLRASTFNFFALVLLASGATAAANDPIQPSPDADQPVDFVRDIQPIFRENCYECHGPRTQESAFRLDQRAGAFAGGESEMLAIEPGDGEISLLIMRVKDEMPGFDPMPPEGDRLTAEQIALLEQWINEGAEWPAEADEIPPEFHWAYFAPKQIEIPAPSRDDWTRNPIDAFILDRLEREGLAPEPPADRHALIRRVTLDLTGLPPTPNEVEVYLADESPGAYGKVVDRLLASPAYGERWARHWLDLARYADSNGYEKDAARSMWPYRDWVIDAFNRDMPFDQFTIEQLAGDMLPGATDAQRIGTGFNRNSMINEEGGVDQEEYRVAAVIDRLNTTFTVFQGITIGCAQCHDHKYDPFSQQEYYSLFAIFNSQRSDVRVVNSFSAVNDGPRVRVPSDDQRRLIEALESESARLKRRVAGARDKEKQELFERLWELRAMAPRGLPTTMVMQDLPEPRETHVHMGGNFRARGEKVQAGVPDVLPPLPPGAEADRLTLARWLVAPSNPLTARVVVNRVWEQYFGHGIVKTTENLGTQGERPVHPELLDWLARNFMWEGWSLKSLHRMIVSSATYQQSSVVTAEKLERDPNNRLLARGARFRLPAESIRDQALAVGGLLSAKIGGPSVFPHQPEGIWKMPYSSSKWRMSKGEDRFRRGLYTWRQRTAPYPAFTTFDAPSGEATCTRRVRTNTPLQALTTLNDPVYVEAAQALARRIMTEPGPSRFERMRFAFGLCLARLPSAKEVIRLADFYDQQYANFSADSESAEKVATQGTLGPPPERLELASLAAWTMVANVLLNLDETLTKG